MAFTYRNLVGVFFVMLFTLGLYFIYWVVQVKKELNARGAALPTAWLLIIPIANIYFAYRFAQEFTRLVLNQNGGVFWLYFLLFVFIDPVAILIMQHELNRAQ